MERVLIGYPLDEHEELENILCSLSTQYSLTIKDYDYGWIRSNIHRFDIIIPSLKTPIDDSVIRNAKNLHLIFSPTTGTDHIRIKTKKESLKILSLNDYKEEINSVSSTAELGFSHLLSLSRKVLLAHNNVIKHGRWERNDFLGVELNNKTIGIVGMGRLGQKTAGYAKAFEMNVIYWDKLECQKWKRIEDLSRLLSLSDYLSISITLNNQTQYLINAGNIAHIKRGAFLVNISRGKVVEEKALCLALREGILAGVGTDVLELELEDHQESALYKYVKEKPDANVIISPHIGGATIEAWKKVFSLVFSKILAGES